MTFLSEFTTQSKTAFSLGTRLIVFSGRNTRSTRNDLMVPKLAVADFPFVAGTLPEATGPPPFLFDRNIQSYNISEFSIDYKKVITIGLTVGLWPPRSSDLSTQVMHFATKKVSKRVSKFFF